MMTMPADALAALQEAQQARHLAEMDIDLARPETIDALADAHRRESEALHSLRARIRQVPAQHCAREV